jgi:hypothetical protein
MEFFGRAVLKEFKGGIPPGRPVLPAPATNAAQLAPRARLQPGPCGHPPSATAADGDGRTAEPTAIGGFAGPADFCAKAPARARGTRESTAGSPLTPLPPCADPLLHSFPFFPALR